jgi:hypothetical protein
VGATDIEHYDESPGSIVFHRGDGLNANPIRSFPPVPQSSDQQLGEIEQGDRS